MLIDLEMALGLDGRRKMSYRNRYVTGPGASEHATWLGMVADGNAERRDGETLPYGGDDLFWLTRAGATAALRGKERLDPEDFPVREGA
jgi:hypothetical protein